MLNIKHKITIIQCYIMIVLNKQMNIDFPNNENQYSLLEQAYQKARTFMKNHNTIIYTL